MVCKCGNWGIVGHIFSSLKFMSQKFLPNHADFFWEFFKFKGFVCLKSNQVDFHLELRKGLEKQSHQITYQVQNYQNQKF